MTIEQAHRIIREAAAKEPLGPDDYTYMPGIEQWSQCDGQPLFGLDRSAPTASEMAWRRAAWWTNMPWWRQLWCRVTRESGPCVLYEQELADE